MSKRLFAASFAIGLVAVGWVAWGFVGTSVLALAVTAVIAAAYLAGAFELRQFRAHTEALRGALDAPAPATLHEWLERVPAALRPAGPTGSTTATAPRTRCRSPRAGNG